MSPLVFAAPLAVVAMVCLWLGWHKRLWLFVAWLAFWVAACVMTLVNYFGDVTRPETMAGMAGAVALFQISIFAGGYLAQRARIGNKSDD